MKKVLMMLATVSMVAMMAACGGGDKESEKTPTSEGKRIAQKMCDCLKVFDDTRDEAASDKCMDAVNEEAEKIRSSYNGDKKKIKEFENAFFDAYSECAGEWMEEGM